MCKMEVIVGVLVVIALVGLSAANVEATQSSDEGLVAEWHFDEGKGGENEGN